jgi:hypothetical protein
MVATIVIGCSIIVFTIPPEHKIIGLSLALILGVPMIYSMNARVSRLTQTR